MATGKNTTPKQERKMVKIHLFKDSGKYKDDVHVIVNGRAYIIQRGVDVEVPDFVADVIHNSMKQQAIFADMVAAKQEEYQNAAKAQIL